MSIDIEFKCPSCQKSISFVDRYLGTLQPCGYCSKSIIVPQNKDCMPKSLPFPIMLDNIYLRRLTTSDWEDMLEYLSDEKLFKYYDSNPCSERDEVIHIISVDNESEFAIDKSITLAIALKENSKIIGDITVSFVDFENLQASFGIMIHSNFQGMGYACEAINGIIDFCFNEINLHRIIASSDSRNIPCFKLLEKVGMRREGDFRKSREINDEWIDEYYYALLKEENN